MFYNFCFVLLLVAASTAQQALNGFGNPGSPISNGLSPTPPPNGNTLPNNNSPLNVLPNPNSLPGNNGPSGNVPPNANLPNPLPGNNVGPSGNLPPNANLPKPLPGAQPIGPIANLPNNNLPGPMFPGSKDQSTPPPVTVITDHDSKDQRCRQRFGYLRIISKCDSYIECRDYRAFERLCPDGMNFNANARWPEYPCGYPTDIPCLGRGTVQPAKPTAECPHQYGFYAVGTNARSLTERCSRYLMCTEGRAVLMDCPFGLAFDDKVGRCNWPEFVPSCRDYLGFTCPPAPLGEDNQPIDIIQNYRYSASECSYFWSCEQGRARILSCDFGLAFDPVSRRCVNEDLVQCTTKNRYPGTRPGPAELNGPAPSNYEQTFKL